MTQTRPLLHLVPSPPPPAEPAALSEEDLDALAIWFARELGHDPDRAEQLRALWYKDEARLDLNARDAALVRQRCVALCRLEDARRCVQLGTRRVDDLLYLPATPASDDAVHQRRRARLMASLPNRRDAGVLVLPVVCTVADPVFYDGAHLHRTVRGLLRGAAAVVVAAVGWWVVRR